jgi:transcriptional regulator with XRE-family HTH domain
MNDTGRNPDLSASDQSQVIAQRLREARETLGMTQGDVADALNIPRTSIVSMEKGTRNISAVELTRLASLYRRSVDWILGQDVEPAETATALYRAAAALSDDDKEQVIRFAQFLAAAGPAPRSGRGHRSGHGQR